MRKIQATFFAAALGVSSFALACPKADKAQAASEKADDTKVTVQDAASLKKAGKVIMVDANGENVRKKEGVVPGARLLTSYRDFDTKELNATKKDTLVFYCYNEKCGAAPAAAKTAAAKGFKTKVMDAGIMGWKNAGFKTQKI